jgi:hypothetical protein
MKIKYNGEELEAEQLRILETDEPWANYIAKDKDGKLWNVRVKTILIAVRKIVGKTAPDGTPAFQCPNNCVISVEERPDDEPADLLTK